jgi:predicted PolB exonuclease-like 3'-5' exonuclease
MSKLSECQIQSMIQRLESSLRMYLRAGKMRQARNTSERLQLYRDELAKITAARWDAEAWADRFVDFVKRGMSAQEAVIKAGALPKPPGGAQ